MLKPLMAISAMVLAPGSASAGCKLRAGTDVTGSPEEYVYVLSPSAYSAVGVLKSTDDVRLLLPIVDLGIVQSRLVPGPLELQLASGERVVLKVEQPLEPAFGSGDFVTHWHPRLHPTDRQWTQLAASLLVSAEIPMEGGPTMVDYQNTITKPVAKRLLKVAKCWGKLKGSGVSNPSTTP